jgi:hypothetical protein
MLYALCSMLYALCSMLYALSMLSLCSMLYALCSMPTHTHTRPHMPTHAQALFKKNFTTLYGFVDIFCGGFLDDFLWLCWQFFCGGFLDDFVDNFLRLYLFCFICITKFVHAVQKSVARFEGWCMKLGGGVCVCKSYSMDSLLLSKSIVVFT